ncbi:unnamed protein product, partial [Musa acuminata subsp. burmannicoides]
MLIFLLYRRLRLKALVGTSNLHSDNRWLELGWAKYSKVSCTMASSKPLQQR